MEQIKIETGENPIEQKKLEIQQLLDEAKAKAISLEEAKDIYQKIDELESAEGDNNDAIMDLEKRLKQGYVRVQTISEFKMLIEKVIGDKKLLDDIVGHENAHANMAQVVGADHEGYSLLIFKDGRNFRYVPSANFAHPSEWITNEKLSDVIRIFNAPNEYGHQTGNSDEKKIERLKKGLPS